MEAHLSQEKKYLWKVKTISKQIIICLFKNEKQSYMKLCFLRYLKPRSKTKTTKLFSTSHKLIS